MKKSVFKFSPTTLIWRFQQKHLKRSSAISPRSSVLQIKVPVWASNPDLCKSMACKGTQVLACKSQQRMQCIGCVSSLLWVREHSPIRRTIEKYLTAYCQAWKNHTQVFMNSSGVIFFSLKNFLCHVMVHVCKQ